MTLLFDPVDKMGVWHGNIAYKAYHSQCTRTNQGYAGGSTGGMDDRFDFMFVTEDVLTGSSGIQYVPNSYQTIGQDGLHYNGNIHIPTNTSVPEDVARALYYMSDHLPISMEIAVGGDVHIEESSELIQTAFVNMHNELELVLKQPSKKLEFRIIDVSGKILLNNLYFSNRKIKASLAFLPSGFYIVSINADGKYSSFKFVISN